MIHSEFCKKLKWDHANKWYIQNPAAVLENDRHKLLLDFDIQTDHLISARRPDLIIINNNKKRSCKIVYFVFPVDQRIKLKESENRISTLTLVGNWEKLWKTWRWRFYHSWLVHSELEDLEFGGRVETIRTTALLRTARILRRVLETWGDFLSLELQWKTIS